jgi:hypothetical protein
MTDVTIHDDDNPEGRPATDEDIAAVLGGLTAADGTSYLDIFTETRDDD